MQDRVTSHLDVNLAKQFALLLREDLRNTFKTVDNPAYSDWWLIQGRKEYPAFAHPILDQDTVNLFESTGKVTIAGMSVCVPKVVQLFAKFRGDVVREYIENGKLDNEKFFSWAIVVGLVDHHLADYVPKRILAMLDQPLPTKQAAQEAKSLTDTAPAATLLMYLLWRIMDERTQQARNIHTYEGRKVYLAWFFSVVSYLKLEPLVAGRWKSWVKAQSSYKGAQLEWTTSKLNELPPKRPISKSNKPFGFNLYGFAYGELGIGEDLRMAVECCEAANIPYHIVNVDAGKIKQADNLLIGKTHNLDSYESPPYRNNIFCLPAFDTASRIFLQKGSKVFDGYYNIGWWPWELSVFPKAWQPLAFKLVDEVWASSKFLFEMYEQSTSKPVRLMPLSVSVDRLVKRTRRYFDLPAKTFLYLYVFDFNSQLMRKNPEIIVKVFLNAFSLMDTNVGLVFKVMNINEDDHRWKNFISLCDSDSRIRVFKDTLAREDLLALINVCNAYVSLHRSEGFGRTIAEAQLLGKPTIATNYSGNVDFMDPEVSFPVDYTLIPLKQGEYFFVDKLDQSVWAEVNFDDSIAMFRATRLIKNLKNYKLKTKSKAIRRFSPKNNAIYLKEWAFENNLPINQ